MVGVGKRGEGWRKGSGRKEGDGGVRPPATSLTGHNATGRTLPLYADFLQGRGTNPVRASHPVAGAVELFNLEYQKYEEKGFIVYKYIETVNIEIFFHKLLNDFNYIAYVRVFDGN